MKTVFDLATELKSNPGRVTLTQALTRDASRPEVGLKGVNGLFGSDAWWRNLHEGKVPTIEIIGTIQRTYCAGQGDGGPPNMIDLVTDEGSVEAVGIYLNDKSNVSMFQPGRRAKIVYALEELKKQPAPDGGVNYSRVALEMSVSADS